MNKKYFLLFGILCFFIVLSIDIYTDLTVDKINHARGIILRTIGLLPSFFLFILFKDNKFPSVFLIAFVVLLMIAFNYWNLFDGLFNIFRGYNWFFTGSEDGVEDAKSDNFLQLIPLWVHIIIKFFGSLGTIILYLLTFKNKRS